MLKTLPTVYEFTVCYLNHIFFMFKIPHNNADDANHLSSSFVIVKAS